MSCLAIQLELPGISCVDGLAQSLDWLLANLRCKPWTRKMYADHARYLLAYFGNIPVKHIDYPVMRNYVRDELRRGLAEETIRKRLSTMKLALREAVYHRQLERLPDFPVVRGRRHPHEGFWIEEQWEAVFVACDADDGLQVWTAVNWWCGSHSSDIDRFRWQDIDFVRKTWVRRNTKTEARPIDLPLPDRLYEILKERYDRIQPNPRDLVCGRRIGHPNRELRELAQRAGVPEICPSEAGRHSCETYMEECGTTELFQMTWLGLKSPAMLKKHYRHATAKTVSAGMEAISAARKKARESSTGGSSGKNQPANDNGRPCASSAAAADTDGAPTTKLPE